MMDATINSMLEKCKKLYAVYQVDLFQLLEKIMLGPVIRIIIRYLLINPKGKLRLTETKALVENCPLMLGMLSTSELHKSNDWYGHASVLKKYANISQSDSIKSTIEHGVFFDNFVWDQDTQSRFPSIITFSKDHTKFLSRLTKKKIYTIGPLIHYAQSFLDATSQKNERARLGKTLLVFPAHSTSMCDVNYDMKKFCKKILLLGKGYSSIRICLYWKDILGGWDKKYRSFGFECVTAGHIFDPLFLPRLKSIIDLSDNTISNIPGTHSGYCIYMNKPHQILSQSMNYYGDRIDSQRSNKTLSNKTYLELCETFSKPTNLITKEQYNLINTYWGLDQIKTKEELGKIIHEAEASYKK